MNLTQKTIAALTVPKGKSEAIFFDDEVPGFGLRLRAKVGASRWIFQYRFGPQQRRVTLGHFPALTVAKARENASHLHARVHLGSDPQAEKVEHQARAAETMAATLQAYLAHQRINLRPRSYVEVERHLNKYCKPLHGLQLAKIDRRIVAGRIAKVTSDSGPPTANRTRASLAAFFSWAIGEGLLDHNPVLGSNRNLEKPRERVLEDDELKAIWAATDGSDDYSAVVRLLALTGCRATEIGSLRWSEINLDKDQIELPSARTKNGRPHAIPMAPAVRAILEGRPRRPDRDLFFGRRQDAPLRGWAVLKEALDKRIKDNGAVVAAWVHHDLRRTFATRLAELGISPHIIEACLNHVSGHKRGVAGVYNRSDYVAQKRHALELWAEHLLAIVEGRAMPSKVVPLRA
jgi:integrase